ncbi:MAG: helix-turn-helix domain-containing protein, partial [Acidobacteriota bacterium]
IMTPRPRIDMYDLPEEMLGRALAVQIENSEIESLQDAKENFEREYILQKLIENKGNVSRAAQALQIERSNLYRKLKQLGIPYSGKENGNTE